MIAEKLSSVTLEIFNLMHDYERGVTSLVIHWNLYHFQTFRLIKPRGGGTDHRWVDGGMIDLSTCG